MLEARLSLRLAIDSLLFNTFRIFRVRYSVQVLRPVPRPAILGESEFDLADREIVDG